MNVGRVVYNSFKVSEKFNATTNNTIHTSTRHPAGTRIRIV